MKNDAKWSVSTCDMSGLRFCFCISSIVELTVGLNGITALFRQLKTSVAFNVATCFDIIKVEILPTLKNT
jgi:hypothetical protein